MAEPNTIEAPPEYKPYEIPNVDQPPPYETVQTTKLHKEDSRVQREREHVEADNMALVNEGGARHACISPQKMSAISALILVMCLPFGSCMCALGALFLSNEASQAEYRGDWTKKRRLIHQAILLNAISITTGLIDIFLMLVFIVGLNHTWH